MTVVMITTAELGTYKDQQDGEGARHCLETSGLEAAGGQIRNRIRSEVEEAITVVSGVKHLEPGR